MRDEIIAAALALLDEEGLDAFSTRKLGSRVGMQAMSLYHHFPDRGAILDAAVDRMIGEVHLPNVARVDWRRGLLQLAQSYRAMGHRHIRAVPLLGQRCPASPAMTAFLDTLLGLVLKSGAPRAAAEAWLLILRDYVIGSLVADHSLHTLSSEAAGSRAEAARFVLPAGARDKMFRKGFDAMLDAIEAEAASCSQHRSD